MSAATAARGGRPIPDPRLELLLFISAMLAGLLSGDGRLEARQVERAAVAASAGIELARAETEASREAPAAKAAPAAGGRTRLVPVPLPEAFAAAGPLRVDERRLE
jgi:hypothetical protein